MCSEMNNTPTERQGSDDLRPVYMRLPSELVAWLTAYAKRKRRTQALVVRRALEQYREKEHE